MSTLMMDGALPSPCGKICKTEEYLAILSQDIINHSIEVAVKK